MIMNWYRKHVGWTLLILASIALTSCAGRFGQQVPDVEPQTPEEVVVVVTATPEPETDDERSGVPVAQAAPDSSVSVRATLTVERERVEIRRSSDSSYRTLRMSQSVFVTSGDVIRTGSGGTAKLVFLDNTETTLFPNTVVVVDAFSRESGGAYTIKLNQLIGSTFNRANFTNSNSTEEVVTPYGVASVRGTGFWVDVVITGPLAAMLLGQELEAFESKVGSAILSGDLNALIEAIAALLGTEPGTVSVDVGAGTVTVTDALGNAVSVSSGAAASSGTSSNGSPIVVSISAIGRYCGDGICDAYMGEGAGNCAADCKTATGRYCGDGICDAYMGEDAGNCAADC
jgi:hypothetical protein